MHAYLDFERPIAELEGKIVELRLLAAADPTMQIDADVSRLQARADQLVKDTYAKLTPWQKVQVARHPGRPHFSDYVQHLFDEFTPLAGDRAFAEDAAIIAALARFQGRAVAVVGQEKGNDTKSRLKHNFGMAMPEGYRKIQRLFGLAERFELPVISLVDTSGAYAGVAAEERGQAEAIAYNLREMSRLECPVIAVVIGEGGSGGALAIGVANRVYLFENAYYSVISPESCAAIIWRDSGKAPQAAAALRLTSSDLLQLGIIDGVVPEHPEGAQADVDAAAQSLRDVFQRALAELTSMSREELVGDRYDKFRRMGNFFHEEAL